MFLFVRHCFQLSPQLTFRHSFDFRSFILSDSSLPNPFMICLAFFYFFYLYLILYLRSINHHVLHRPGHHAALSLATLSLSTSASATAASPPLSMPHDHGHSHSLGHAYPLGYGHAYSHSHGGYTTLAPELATAGVNATGKRHLSLDQR